MNTESALVAAAKIGAKRTYFTHMTFEVDYETAQKTLPDNIFYAWDGLRIVIRL